MSLWADYVREREGLEVIEKDYGFICYKFFLPNECFIQALYIRPEDRVNGKGSELEEEVGKMAIAKGCGLLTCKIDHLNTNSTLSLKAILARGFQIVSADKQVIYCAKELKK